ncbi:MAG TPA: hypothetical protein VF074_01205, partial [Pyrinomonadaceae bacterium]
KTVKGAGERESYLPVQLLTNDDAQLVAFPLKWGGSSDFVGFSQATALVIVPAGVKVLEGGALVKIVRI